ncbi:MAG TPA: DUF3226 domain-containing protein [Thermoguttaceae bacterium]|nr:DUF3226 domain-containing protein [Thermoguttaceae bacterium]
MDKRVLLVEGRDDQHVMWNLLGVREVPEKFKVERPKADRDSQHDHENEADGGDRVLLDSIPWWLLQTGLERLAVVVDANDKGPEARWESLRARLLYQGYRDIPARHSEDGTVFELSLRPRTPRSVRFGVWIMPDNRSTGMLEDFVMQLIREDDEMLPFVDRFLDLIPDGQRRFKKQHRPKARIHSWLAVSEKPGRPMGQAIKADRQLDANDPAVQPFLDWLMEVLIADGNNSDA